MQVTIKQNGRVIELKTDIGTCIYGGGYKEYNLLLEVMKLASKLDAELEQERAIRAMQRKPFEDEMTSEAIDNTESINARLIMLESAVRTLKQARRLDETSYY